MEVIKVDKYVGSMGVLYDTEYEAKLSYETSTVITNQRKEQLVKWLDRLSRELWDKEGRVRTGRAFGYTELDTQFLRGKVMGIEAVFDDIFTPQGWRKYK